MPREIEPPCIAKIHDQWEPHFHLHSYGFSDHIRRVQGRKMRLLGCVAFVLCLSGCVGAFVPQRGENRVPATSCAPGNERGHLASLGRDRLVSRADFMAAWGAPDAETTRGDDVLLTYKNGLKWRGLAPFIFPIPIPLVLPVGANTTTLTFRGNVCESAIEEFNKTLFYGCGWFVSDESSKVTCQAW